MLKQLWKVTPKVTGGFCWYLEWEQFVEMDAMGIEQISRDVIKITDRLKLKKALIKIMKKFYKDNVFPRIIVKAGAVSDTGR